LTVVFALGLLSGASWRFADRVAAAETTWLVLCALTTAAAMAAVASSLLYGSAAA
jgi:hypothetical protein